MRAISKRTASFSVAIAVFALIGAGCHQSNNSSSILEFGGVVLGIRDDVIGCHGAVDERGCTDPDADHR